MRNRPVLTLHDKIVAALCAVLIVGGLVGGCLRRCAGQQIGGT